MRHVALVLALCLTPALCAQAVPPNASPPPPPPNGSAAPPVSHSRIGEMMGSLTRALREAAEQRRQGHPTATVLTEDAPAATPAAQTPTTTLPDANAQAAVP
jgi:hypothetical protein